MSRSSEVKNTKARNTATPVACSCAGAIFEVSGAFGQEQLDQKPNKTLKKQSVMDGPMDGPTDRLADGHSENIE